MATIPSQSKPFVDRTEELRLFKELLKCTGQLRVLAITQKPLYGKSELLRRLRSLCMPPVMVSLVESHPDKADPLEFVRAIKRDLEGFDLKFPRTDKELDRLFPTGHQVTIDLSNADLKGANNFRIAGVENAPPTNLSVEQRLVVRDRAYVAFMAELIEHARTQTIVVLVDAFEKWEETTDVYQWFHRPFLTRLFFAGADDPPNLLLIVAGQTMPAFDDFPGPLVTARVVHQTLGTWGQEHLLDYFKQRLGRKPKARETALLRALVLNGMSPGQMASVVENLPPP